MPLNISSYYDDCPYCGIGVRITNDTIIRHERGLSYIPYRLYHKFHRHQPNDPDLTVKSQMQRNLCPASGKSPEEAMQLWINKTKKKDQP